MIAITIIWVASLYSCGTYADMLTPRFFGALTFEEGKNTRQLYFILTKNQNVGKSYDSMKIEPKSSRVFIKFGQATKLKSVYQRRRLVAMYNGEMCDRNYNVAW